MMFMQKKSHPQFNVPNLGAKNRSRVQDRWRRQRGIDNKKRINRSGYGASPSIGYKNVAAIRFRRPDGTTEVLIHNENELLNLASRKDATVVARIAHDVSRRRRIGIQRLADINKVRIVNRRMV